MYQQRVVKTLVLLASNWIYHVSLTNLVVTKWHTGTFRNHISSRCSKQLLSSLQQQQQSCVYQLMVLSSLPSGVKCGVFAMWVQRIPHGSPQRAGVKLLNVTFIDFRRNATHCISPYAIIVCMCVCVCVSVFLCVCMPRLWTSGKRFEIETSFCFKLREITPDITCKRLTQIGLQIPRWRTKSRPWNTIIDCDSAIY